jgi:hypothetical protein
MILGVSTVADRGFLTLAILSLSGGVIHVSWRGFWISFKFSVLVTPIPSSDDTSVRGSGETCRFLYSAILSILYSVWRSVERGNWIQLPLLRGRQKRSGYSHSTLRLLKLCGDSRNCVRCDVDALN